MRRTRSGLLVARLERKTARRQNLAHRVRIDGLREVEALAPLATKRLQSVDLLRVLDALGDHLEPERPAELDDRVCDCRFLGAVPDALDQPRMLELLGRNVDAQADLGIVDRPVARLTAGLSQHPAPERDDESTLLRQRDELGGGDQTPALVLPTDQGLDTEKRTLFQTDDRLVVKDELVLLYSVLELALDLETS